MARQSQGLSITLQQFAYFLDAVEYGSLSAAAEANYIAQPSLSEQIRRMERALGVALFVRTNRTLILTEAGRTLIPHAEIALETAKKAVNSVAPLHDMTGGTVTVGTFSTARSLIHSKLISEFRHLYPEVRLRIISDNSVKIANEVRDGKIEAGVVALPVDDNGLESVPFTWSPQVYYFSADPERAARPKDISALAEATLVLPEVAWGDSDPTRRRLMELAQQQGLTITPAIEASSTTALKVAASGIADTLASYPLALSTDTAHELHWAPLNPVMRENFAFVKRRNAALSPGTAIVLELITNLFTQLPPDAPEHP